MTLEEYKNRLKEIAKEKDVKEALLAKEYVEANNPYKVGDIVEDHIGKVLIERIRFAYALSGIPCAVYFGSELKKDNSQKKNGSKRDVYQTNLRNI